MRKEKKKRQKNKEKARKKTFFSIEIFFVFLVLFIVIVLIALSVYEIQKIKRPPLPLQNPTAAISSQIAPQTKTAEVRLFVIEGVIGTESNIKHEGFTDLLFTINGKRITNETIFGKQEVLFFDKNFIFMNFSHDFSEADFNLSRITLNVTSTFLIVNLSGQLITNKTLFFKDNNFSRVCVKDAEVGSVEEISTACNREGEIDFTSCIGNSAGITRNGITCTDEGTEFKFEALNFTGIRGTVSGAVAGETTARPGKRFVKREEVEEIERIELIPVEEEELLEKIFTEMYYPYAAKPDHFMKVYAVYTGDDLKLALKEHSLDSFLTLGLLNPFPDIATLYNPHVYGMLEFMTAGDGTLKKLTLAFNVENGWLSANGPKPSIYLYNNGWKTVSPFLSSSDEYYYYYKISTNESIDFLIITSDLNARNTINNDKNTTKEEVLFPFSLEIPSVEEQTTSFSWSTDFVLFNILLLAGIFVLLFYFCFPQISKIISKNKKNPEK